MGRSQKTLLSPWCPKLVTGLLRGGTAHERKDELAFLSSGLAVARSNIVFLLYA